MINVCKLPYFSIVQPLSETFLFFLRSQRLLKIYHIWKRRDDYFCSPIYVFCIVANGMNLSGEHSVHACLYEWHSHFNIVRCHNISATSNHGFHYIYIYIYIILLIDFKNSKWLTYLCILLCICYCLSHLIGLFSVTWLSLLYNFTRFFIYFQFLSDEGPMLETLDYTIRIGSTLTILYFDLI